MLIIFSVADLYRAARNFLKFTRTLEKLQGRRSGRSRICGVEKDPVPGLTVAVGVNAAICVAAAVAVAVFLRKPSSA